MNKYRLQIANIEKYAREFWDDFNEIMEEDTTGSYVSYMTNDTSEVHNHICEALIVANHWGNNCSIPKEDFTIQELNENNELVKSYTYDEAWELLPKKKVIYKADMEKLTHGNIDSFLEPIRDFETNNIICNTNSGNLMYMIHFDLIDNYLNEAKLEEVLEVPVYLLDKVNNRSNGALNKYFDE